MEKEKKCFGGWWVWIVTLLIGSMIVFTILNYAGIFGKTVVERVVFENSYQKHEADRDAVTTYDAQISQLKGKLRNPDVSAGTKAEIKAQIDAINILKMSKN